MTGVPQVIVTISPNDELVVELPGFSGSRRKVELTQGNVEATLLRILKHLRLGQAEIGFDGAPTQAQVEHWEKHVDWPKESCRFCIAEGRIKGSDSTRKRRLREIVKRSDGVEVKRIAPKGEKGSAAAPGPSIDELGL